MQSKVPHPSQVGNSFVKQYYQLLASSPSTLHRFYKDDSKFTHGVGSAEQDAISGQKNINAKIMSMNFEGAHVDLECGSVDCQASLDGGVLVMVSGLMSLKDTRPQAFVQTFFLAVQETGYFVLNDAFRYLESSAKNTQFGTVPSSPVKTSTATQMTAPSPTPTPPMSPPMMVKSPLMAPSSPMVMALQSPAMNSSPVRSRSPTKTPKSPLAVPSPKVTSPVTEVAPQEEVPTGPKSWASHLFAAKAGAVPAPAPVATPTAPASSKQNKKQPSKDANNGQSGGNSKRNQISVLIIRDIPTQTKDSDLRDLFKEFGTITAVNVVSNRGHAFVDFEHMDSVKKALAGGRKFTLFDKTISVEEKYQTSTGGNRNGNRNGNGNGNRFNNQGNNGQRQRQSGGGGGRGGRRPGGNAGGTTRNTAATPASGN